MSVYICERCGMHQQADDYLHVTVEQCLLALTRKTMELESALAQLKRENVSCREEIERLRKYLGKIRRYSSWTHLRHSDGQSLLRAIHSPAEVANDALTHRGFDR
jgi:regulator of replication initiation timing